MSKNKKIRKTFSLDQDAVLVAERRCAHEDRTMSNMVNHMLRKEMREELVKKARK